MELLNWEFLLTYAGCILGTSLIVELLKGFLPLQTRLLSYLVAVAIFNAAALALSVWAWQDGLLSLLNGAIVALASNGGYDLIQRLKAGKQSGTIDGAGGVDL